MPKIKTTNEFEAIRTRIKNARSIAELEEIVKIVKQRNAQVGGWHVTWPEQHAAVPRLKALITRRRWLIVTGKV